MESDLKLNVQVIKSCRKCPFCNYLSEEGYSCYYCVLGEFEFGGKRNIPTEVEESCPLLEEIYVFVTNKPTVQQFKKS